MKIIGITGGVGSGKSRVLSYLEATYGAYVCQADHVAWELQMPGTSCYKRIVAHFGEAIISQDATIDRAKLGQIVFTDSEQLEVLNSIMHPAVKAEICDRIREQKEHGTRLFVLEAALLIEEKYDEICDVLWYIYTSDAIRRQRLKDSREYSDEKIDRMISSQLSENVFREKCQYVIDNNEDFAGTIRQIKRLLEEQTDEIM